MELNDILKLLPEYPDKADFPIYWSNALSGEVGEICNLTKKQFRDELDVIGEIKDEIGDCFNYLAYLCKSMNIDMELAILEKIDKIKMKIGEK
jgi:NTP pyrophosphatase (non-canonical NTP hydrolase)